MEDLSAAVQIFGAAGKSKNMPLGWLPISVCLREKTIIPTQTNVEAASDRKLQ